MGSFRHHSFGIQVNPPLPKNSQIKVNMSPLPLLYMG